MDESCILFLGPWTVFAPDNDAWQSLPKEIFDHIVNDPILLKHMLSYHIVQANATRQQLINDQKLPTLYENRPIHINFYTDGWASVSAVIFHPLIFNETALDFENVFDSSGTRHLAVKYQI